MEIDGAGQIYEELFPNGYITTVASYGNEITFDNSEHGTPFWISDFSNHQVEIQGLARDAQGNLYLRTVPWCRGRRLPRV